MSDVVRDKAGDVMMPVAVGDLTEQMHLVLLRQLIDSVSNVNTQLRDMNTVNLDVVQRLSRIEANKMDERVELMRKEAEALEARLGALEKIRQQSMGAQAMLVWFKDFTPWILLVAGVVYAYITKRPS